MLTPVGVNDFFPEEMADFEAVLGKLNGVFQGAGYQKVRTPSLEYYDTLAVGMGPEFSRRAVKLFDVHGEVMVLRPDHTVPIARMVATRLHNRPLPLRLSYFNSIFRTSKGWDQDIETFQAGAELLGATGPEADAEMVALCIASLKALGYTDFVVDIGHTQFAQAFSQDAHEALLNGDYVTLGQIPVRGEREVISQYPELCLMDEILSKKGLSPYVRYNKGLVKELDYYTGLIFECCVPGFSAPVGSGGRYDGLLGKFGFPCPAVGFALHLSELL